MIDFAFNVDPWTGKITWTFKQMSCYPETQSHIRDKNNVLLDLYATKKK